MPNKPTTLREEFEKEFVNGKVDKTHSYFLGYKLPNLVIKEITDWWLDKFSSHNTELLQKIEGMKKEECKEGGFGHEHNPWDCGEKLCEFCQHIQDGKCKNPMSTCDTRVHNSALDEVISLITQEK